MAVRNLSVLLTANDTNLRTVVTRAGSEIDHFANKVKTADATANGSFKAMALGAAALGTAVAVGFAYAASKAIGFQREMLNVNTVSNLTTTQLASLSKQVLELSTRVPQSAQTLASGLYDIASSGFQGADGLKVLKASSVAASAGLTDTATAGKAIVQILNSYGLGADQAAHVSDVLFQTVNLGVVSFSELAASMGQVTAIASAAKIPVNDVGSAVAAMTLGGLDAAESTTSLQRVIQALLQPSDALAGLYHKLGYESGSQALAQDGLYKVMERIRIATGGNVDAYLKLFPEIRAARGAFILAENGGANYAKTQKEIGDNNKVAGATQKAFNIQMQGLGQQLQIAKNKIDAAAISLGTKLLPYLGKALAFLLQFGETVSSGLGEAAAFLGEKFGPVLANLVDLLGQMADVAEPVAKALSFAGLAAAVGIITTATAGLASMFGWLSKNRVAVDLLTAGIGIYLVLAIYRAVAAMAVGAFETVALKAMYAWDGLTAAVGGYTAAVAEAEGVTATFGAVLAPLAPIILAAFAIGGIVAFNNLLHSSDERAKKLIQDARKGNDEKTFKGLHDSLVNINKLLDEADRKSKGYSGLAGGGKALLEIITPLKNGLLDADSLSDKARKQLHDLADTGGKGLELLRNLAYELYKPWIESGKNAKDVENRLSFVQGFIAQIAASKKIDIFDPNMLKDPEKVKQTFAELKDAVISVAAGNTNLDALDGAFKTLADDTSTAADKLSAYKTLLDTLSGNQIAAQDSLIGYRNAIRDLGESVSKNGRTFDVDANIFSKHSKAADENRSKLDAVGKAILDNATAVATSTGKIENGTVVLAAQRAELEKYLSSIGYTKPQIDELMTSLGLTDTNLKKVIDGSDQNKAKKQVDDVKKAMQDAAKQNPTLKFNLSQLQEAERQVLQLKSDIAGLNSGTGANNLGPGPTPHFKPNGEPLHWYDPSTGKSGFGNQDTTGSAQSRGSVMEFYANGGRREDHIAQIAPAGAWRLWAEPETGGEAYIPMGKNKRPRSKQILEEVAHRFGYKLDSYDVGGIINQQRNREAYVNQVAGAGGTFASFAAAAAGKKPEEIQSLWQEMARTFQEVSDKAGAAAARALANSGLVGQAYSDAASKIIEAADAEKTFHDNLLRNEHDAGAISDTAYLKGLEQRIKGLRKYSDEWQSVYQEIQSVKQSIRQSSNDKQDFLFETGKTDTSTYLHQLNQRLSGLKAYSQEWYQVMQQIQQQQRTLTDPLKQQTSIFAGITGSSGAPPTFADVRGKYTHLITITKQWSSGLRQLAKLGLNKQLLAQLIEMGPSGLPVVQALLAEGAKGVKELNADYSSLTKLTADVNGSNLGLLAPAKPKPVSHIQRPDGGFQFAGNIGVKLDASQAFLQAVAKLDKAGIEKLLEKAFGELAGHIASGAK